jgi:hypothetical protein
VRAFGKNLKMGAASMTRSARVRLFVFIVGIFVFLPALSHGQDLAGLLGTVTDESGGAITKATVTLVNTRTGSTTQAQTGDTGSYRFVQLAPGPGYELKVSKDGFKSITISNLYLAVATTRTQDVQLSLGTVTQTVFRMNSETILQTCCGSSRVW